MGAFSKKASGGGEIRRIPPPKRSSSDEPKETLGKRAVQYGVEGGRENVRLCCAALARGCCDLTSERRGRRTMKYESEKFPFTAIVRRVF